MQERTGGGVSRLPRVRIGAAIAVAIAIAFVAWLLVRNNDDSSSSSGTTRSLGPVAASQDRIRERGEKVAGMLQNDDCYVYICGLKGMEDGVVAAFRDVCREHGLDWDALKPQLLAKSRLHIETY